MQSPAYVNKELKRSLVLFKVKEIHMEIIWATFLVSPCFKLVFQLASGISRCQSVPSSYHTSLEIHYSEKQENV